VTEAAADLAGSSVHDKKISIVTSNRGEGGVEISYQKYGVKVWR